MSLVVGDDGLVRCAWAAGTPDYYGYHDDEWGRPVHGDVPLFERLVLEGFQSGLSWLVILRKRPGFRAAFDGFDPERIAQFDDADVERLMGDAGIVRNRAKISATIRNAQALVRLRDDEGDGALDRLMWGFAPPSRPRRRPDEPGVSTTPESVALSKALKRRGFGFVGPTTAYAGMQACGLVDDHVDGCHVPVAATASR